MALLLSVLGLAWFLSSLLCTQVTLMLPCSPWLDYLRCSSSDVPSYGTIFCVHCLHTYSSYGPQGVLGNIPCVVRLVSLPQPNLPALVCSDVFHVATGIGLATLVVLLRTSLGGGDYLHMVPTHDVVLLTVMGAPCTDILANMSLHLCCFRLASLVAHGYTLFRGATFCSSGVVEMCFLSSQPLGLL